jgi:hypothetical protein
MNIIITIQICYVFFLEGDAPMKLKLYIDICVICPPLTQKRAKLEFFKRILDQNVCMIFFYKYVNPFAFLLSDVVSI